MPALMGNRDQERNDVTSCNTVTIVALIASCAVFVVVAAVARLLLHFSICVSSFFLEPDFV